MNKHCKVKNRKQNTPMELLYHVVEVHNKKEILHDDSKDKFLNSMKNEKTKFLRKVNHIYTYVFQI